MSQQPRILVVEHEEQTRRSIVARLNSEGYALREAQTAAEARQYFPVFRPDAALVDGDLPDGHVLGLIPQLHLVDHTAPIIVLTRHGSLELAVEILRAGAENILPLPLDGKALITATEKALHHRRQRQGLIAAKVEWDDTEIFQGSTPEIRTLRQEAHIALESRSPVLIQGETGTGKGVLAKWIHRHGSRSRNSFVDVNCAGLSEQLLASELFGHARGSFTGAIGEKEGLIEAAHRGLLFLDEIGDMSMDNQARVLKVIEEKKFRRVGETRERHVDVQLITATHRDLFERIREEQFRQDLYYRISAIVLRVPPLRDRKKDLPGLVGSLLHKLEREVGTDGFDITPQALAALEEHSWPGNIRELRNVLERAALSAKQGVIDRKDLRVDTTGSKPVAGLDPGLTIKEAEAMLIKACMRAQGGDVNAAAKSLGIARSTLYQRLRDLRLDTGASSLAS